ncbi:MAG: hypothetical protein LBP28_05710 [Coriobacteriales bacterium]|jgi:hypothetical protein|nr:hypothetical protein [Coriobacteriales bacterium]
MPRNTLQDLNNHLFEALERINDDELTDEQLDKELRRARAMTGVASQIIAGGQLAASVLKMREQAGDANMKIPPMLKAGE